MNGSIMQIKLLFLSIFICFSTTAAVNAQSDFNATLMMKDGTEKKTGMVKNFGTMSKKFQFKTNEDAD